MNRDNFAAKIIRFNSHLEYTGGKLPAGIRIMNPFAEDPAVMPIVKQFYTKFYGDTNARSMIIGINPGRFGGGVTGIPFTDPKRLAAECGIPFDGQLSHEPSSVFVYDVIKAYGGPERFYSQFYINSVCPLGFTSVNAAGKEVNYNYYDSPALESAVKQFSVDSLKKQLTFGIASRCAMIFGTGKNEKYIRKLNDEHLLFSHLIAVEHPRYIMQYKSKLKSFYIDKYCSALDEMEKLNHPPGS